jgi:hypothetical protein
MDKTKQKWSNKRKPKTSTIPSLDKGNPNNNRVQKGLDLGFHGLVLWGRFGCIAEIGEVLNGDRAYWVVCFVGCTAGGASEGGVDTSATSVAGGDSAAMVPCGMLLGAYSADWFLCFAQFCMVSVALAVVAL